MPHPNLISVACYGIAFFAIFIAICVVHWSNWKKMKAAKEDALKREIQSYNVLLESKKPIAFARTVKKIYKE